MPSAKVEPPNGRSSPLSAFQNDGIERRLHPDDLDRRRPGAGGDGVAGDQPAAADRDHQGVEVVRVLEHFQRDGALARDHQRVVVGVDEGEAALGGKRLRAHLRLRHALALEHDLGAVRLRRLDLHERRGHRHHDGGRDPQPRGVVGDRLGVVAGGHGDHAPRPRGRVERGELVERAAILERVGDLEILVFHMDVGAGQRRELGGRQHRRAQHLARDRAARRLDVRNGDAHLTLMPDLLPAGGARPDGAKPRASCARTVYSPFAGGVKIASTAGGDSADDGPEEDRRVDRRQAPCLRPGGQSGIVRRCAGAPVRRLPHRRDHPRDPGHVRGDIHLHLRRDHARDRLGALLAALARGGDLGDLLLRLHLRQPGLGHDRDAGHGSGDAHLVRRARLFRARGGARDRLLGHRLVPHAVHPADRLLQPPSPAAARYAGGYHRHQQSRAGASAARAAAA